MAKVSILICIVQCALGFVFKNLCKWFGKCVLVANTHRQLLFTFMSEFNLVRMAFRLNLLVANFY